MKTKERLITVILMLLSTAAGIYVYQNFFNNADDTDSYSNITASKPNVDTNNIDLATLIAKDLSGSNVDLSAYQGKHLIINFWATWCPPCRKEIPLLIETQKNHADQDVQVLGIAMDEADKIEKYMQDVGFNYPSLIADLNQTTRFSQALDYEFIALPFTFFLDKNGKLVHTKTGELKRAELSSLVTEMTQ